MAEILEQCCYTMKSVRTKKPFKRFLALIMALTMIFGMVQLSPITVQAADEEQNGSVILAKDAVWSYLMNGTNLDGVDWMKQDSTYSTSEWATGAAPIGYASSTSTAYSMLSTKLVKPSTGSYTTTYFKTTIEIPEETDLSAVKISGSRLIDDGAFLYVNGVCVYTYNVTDPSSYSDWAINTINTPQWTDFTISAEKNSAFKVGTNVVAVVLKNRGSESSDAVMAFELSLEQGEVVPPQKLAIKNITMQPGTNESSMNFCWYSDVTTTAAVVQLAKKSDMMGTDFPVSATSFVSAQGTLKPSVGVTPAVYNSNKATVEGLESGTEYVYRVGDGTDFSDTYSFRTSSPAEGYSAILVGDPQIGSSGSVSGDTTGWSSTLQSSITAFPETDFILSAGDQVETNSSEEQYDGFFQSEKLRYIPLVPTIGNHDNGALYSYHYNSPNESSTYGTSTAGGDYWFTYGNTLYMVLNSNNKSGATHEAFIGNAITANLNVKWKVVMFHHSIYSSASHSDDNEILNLRRDLYPVFDSFDIDVVLQGHDHCYTRSYQMLGGEAQITQSMDSEGRVVNPTGTLYITANSGSGSKYYDFINYDTSYMAVRWQGHVPSYSNISVTDETFAIKTYESSTGNVIDTYTIYKGEPTDIQTNYSFLTAALNAEIGTNRQAPVYALKKADYTAESWSVYEDSITAGVSMEQNTEATQSQVDNAKLAIVSAKALLVPKNNGNLTPYFITMQPGATETSVRFSWATATGDGTCFVQIAKTSDMIGDYTFPESSVIVPGTVFPAASDIYSCKSAVTGLAASTSYSYRVGYGSYHSTVKTFTTGSGTDYSALLVGDPQIGASGSIQNDLAGWNNTVTKMLDNFGDASFILSAGDQVDKSDSTEQYLGFFAPQQLQSIPLAPTIGNHDDNMLYQLIYNSSNVSTQYGVTAAGGDYWFSYGNTLYMVLNSNDKNALSHDSFMSQAVAANPDATWKVVMFHHSIYSSASHSTEQSITDFRSSMTPIIDKYDVDVVFQGHDHCYTRTYQMLGGETLKDQAVDAQGRVVNPSGTVYFTANSASGSKYYDLKAATELYSAVRLQLQTPTYSRVQVTEDTFTVTTYRTDNDEMVDTYSIYKGEEVTPPDTTAPILTAGVATRVSHTQATASFTSNEDGEYYYAVTQAGAEAPSINTEGTGVPCAAGVKTTITMNDLSAGAKDIYVAVKDTAGNVSDTVKLSLVKFHETIKTSITSPSYVLVDQSQKSVTFSVSVEQLEDVDVLEGLVSVDAQKFSITGIKALYEGENFIFTKNLDYKKDGSTAYISFAQIGGLKIEDDVTVLEITVTLKDGVSADYMEAALASVSMYYDGYEVDSVITGSGTSKTVLIEMLGDLNGDDSVNGADLSYAMRYFGSDSDDAIWETVRILDFNNNGAIDIGDLTYEAWIVAHQPEVA